MKRIILISVLVIVSFVIGFILGRQTLNIEPETSSTVTDTVPKILTGKPTASSTTQTEDVTPAAPDTTSIVETSQLTPEQRKLLGTFGIDADALVVTATMITCAENKIGKARLDEIFDGATPTFFEGVDLFSCYQQ
jgi:hypothetical protein